MSMVYIKDHDESIYQIRYSPNDFHDEHPFHRDSDDEERAEEDDGKADKARRVKIPEEKSCYREHSSWGPPNVRKPDPKQFLKKRTGQGLQSNYIQTGTRKPKPLVTPPVPDTKETVKEQNKRLAYVPQNIIKRNIERVVNARPKSPKRIIVVDSYGTKKNLCDVNEVKYTSSQQYARLPKFIAEYKMMRDNKILVEKHKHDKQNQPKCMYIIRDHRKNLLEGLKKNWEDLQGQYQTLPILTDTLPKKNKKSHIETQLRQLEKDIVFVERHPYIYVYQDE